jgi:hypothetical protein
MLQTKVQQWTEKAQSVYRLVTGWTVWGSNPVGGEIFLTRPDRCWDPSRPVLVPTHPPVQCVPGLIFLE